ncbi:hypothetical protein GJAV_G00024950 [Gymnothorax javanicus]|nr:hypothetical protein GJAV_G00024950 [Gymnothorax javanicus]
MLAECLRRGWRAGESGHFLSALHDSLHKAVVERRILLQAVSSSPFFSLWGPVDLSLNLYSSLIMTCVLPVQNVPVRDGLVSQPPVENCSPYNFTPDSLSGPEP